MFIQNALNYGHEIITLDPDPEAPCSKISHNFVCADRNDEQAVYELGSSCDVVTIEIENVSVAALERLEKSGKKVYPQPRVLSLIKDKGAQKAFYKKHNFATAEFALIDSNAEIDRHADLLPAMQKLRVGGYDGKGVIPIKSKDDIASGFSAPSVLEKWVDFEMELAVIVGRNSDGEVKSFPAVEQVFNPEANLVDYLVSPARIAPELESEARKTAEKIIKSLDMIGVLAVEFFVTKSGQLLVNEIAPRPHNSGHHTIEACYVSQFDMHLRAILNMPLGDTGLRSPAAMINLLGEKGHTGLAKYHGLEDAVAHTGVFPHIYGKTHTKPYRKMGHITVLGQSTEDALEKAGKIKSIIKVIT